MRHAETLADYLEFSRSLVFKTGRPAWLVLAMEYQIEKLFYAKTKVDWAMSPFHPSLIDRSINKATQRWFIILRPGWSLLH